MTRDGASWSALARMLAFQGVHLGIDESAPECDPSVLLFTFKDGTVFELTAENDHVLFIKTENAGDPDAARILTAAEIYATHDPDVDWPSESGMSSDPVDAIMAAFDNYRERVALEEP